MEAWGDTGWGSTTAGRSVSQGEARWNGIRSRGERHQLINTGCSMRCRWPEHDHVGDGYRGDASEDHDLPCLLSLTRRAVLPAKMQEAAPIVSDIARWRSVRESSAFEGR